MKITLISDTHGALPELQGGDLLIVAGDITARDSLPQYLAAFDWIERHPYTRKIVCAGNHDNYFQENGITPHPYTFEYLEDEGTTFENLKIWATPRSLWFDGINPLCNAFTGSERELSYFFEQIPDDIDILISHGPAKWILDKTRRGDFVGSFALRTALERIQPSLFVCGHIHEAYGTLVLKGGKDTLCVNASHMDENYNPTNIPINVEMCDGRIWMVPKVIF